MKQQDCTGARTRSWREYNNALVQRGSLTLWIDESAVESWTAPIEEHRRGTPKTYSDMAILMMASLKEIYRLTLRPTEGLLQSIFKLLGVTKPVPDYSTLCRRRRRLSVPITTRPADGPLHLVVDATGLKLYGDGEWMRVHHRKSRNRRWRKLHLGVDEATQQIVAAAVSDNDVTDGQMLETLLEQVSVRLVQVSGDGAYDKRHCYEALRHRSARAAIPPQRRAKIWQHGNCAAPPHARDENLRYIRRHGRKAWKKYIGYHRRSLAETAMSRLKTIFGDRLRARRIDAQTTELMIRVGLLNRLRDLGQPPPKPAT